MAHNAEAEKQRYARELAAYTLQQWNIAKERQVEREKERIKSDKSHSTRSPCPPTPPEDYIPNNEDEAVNAAVKAVDYAMRTTPTKNGDT